MWSVLKIFNVNIKYVIQVYVIKIFKTSEAKILADKWHSLTLSWTGCLSAPIKKING